MFKHLLFRPHPAPSLVLPLNVRSAGHYLLDQGSREVREAGAFIQIFWCLRGSGRMKLGTRRVPFRSGMVFYYRPGEIHHLESGQVPLEYRWLTLDGSEANRIPQRFGLKRGHQAGPCPVDLFTRLDPCLQNATGQGERQASLLAYEILLLAASSHGEKSFPEGQIHAAVLAKAWLENHFTDARLNVSALSQRFHIHRSTLYRIFSKKYGVAPVQYLNRLRIGYALQLLTEGSLPVADVAVRAGLPDIAYFSRLIRRNTGFSPRTYRLQHGIRKTGLSF